MQNATARTNATASLERNPLGATGRWKNGRPVGPETWGLEGSMYLSMAFVKRLPGLTR